MKRFALLALPLAIVACGDNNDENRPIDAAVDTAVIDTAVIDTPLIDTPPPIDAVDAPPPPVHGGTISVLEAALLNPGTSGTFFGQGVQVGISFSSSANVPAPVLEEQPGSPLGCKVWEYTPAQAAASSIGEDQGQVQIFSPAGQTATSLTAPCTFTTGVGYTCPHTATFSTGGTIGAGPQAGLLTLTDTDVTYNAGNTTNRYVNIQGAATAANNGTFPIVALGGANTIVYANPAGAAETLPGTAAHVNLSGVGPTPSAPDPGFLADNVSVDFVKAAGPDIAALTATTTAGGSVGDDFVLATAELNKLNAIPRDGSMFTISCTATDCPAGSASGTLINIITTDAPTTGLSPFAMPAPVTKRVQVRCAALGATSITVPPAYSARIMTSGATRIQATFIRPTLMGGGPANVTSISGHAIVGYTN